MTGTIAPTTEKAPATSSTTGRRRRRQQQQQQPAVAVPEKNLLEQLACLWKPASPSLSPPKDEKKRGGRKAAGLLMKSQDSASTFLEEEWSGNEDEDNDVKEKVVLLPPPEDASPRELVEYYEACLNDNINMEWTERANLYYTTGCLHVKLRNYQAATQAFESEARLLKSQGAGPGALVPIYKSLGKLWTVRQPHTALHYYERALECCCDAQESQQIRHAMGRLLFQTGNLERAMQLTIVGQPKTTTTTAASSSL